MSDTSSSRPERRRHPRRPLATRIDLSEPHDAAFFSGQTLNVSRRGVAVRTRETVPEVGSRLDFGFRPEAGRPPVRGTLEIVWVRPFEGPEGDHEFGARVTWWCGERRPSAEGSAAEEDDDPTLPAVRSENLSETAVPERSAAPGEGPRTDARPPPGSSPVEPWPRTRSGRRLVSLAVLGVLIAVLAIVLAISVVAERRSTEAPPPVPLVTDGGSRTGGAMGGKARVGGRPAPRAHHSPTTDFAQPRSSENKANALV